MKVQNGKLKLGKNDIQLGNFILSKEKEHYKMQDINGYWSTRISHNYSMYTLIEECVKAKNMDYLQTIIMMLYCLSCSALDPKMLADVNVAFRALMDRMAAQQEADRDDEKALQDVKNAHEAKEELKKVLDAQPEGNKDR